MTTLGKFEGEPEWVESFWQLGLDGDFDLDIDGHYLFKLTKDDYDEFPELKGVYGLMLLEDEQGFVRAKILETKKDYLEEIDFLESLEEE